jgi:hypothetical protein
MESTGKKVIPKRQYELYGTNGAVQFHLSKSRDDESSDKYTLETWDLFIEAAKVLPNNPKHYDWSKGKKIQMAIGLTDLGILLNGFRTGFKGVDPKTITEQEPKGQPYKYELYHDPGKGTASEGAVVRRLSIAPGQRYGYKLSISQAIKNNGTVERVDVEIPLDDKQMCVLKVLLERAVVMIAGWLEY